MSSRAEPAGHQGGLAARQAPAWFDEAKLGIFVHWNAAAIPAFAPVVLLDELPDDPTWARAWRRLPFAEMYQNSMAVPGSPTARYHAQQYGELPYDAFVAQFRDEVIPRWDPEPWADLFARAGARYVVLTTKTEDGFALWPSANRNPHKAGWQSGRDVVGELASAVRARDVRFGTYYCGGVDWTFGGIPTTDGASLLASMPESDEYITYVDAHWRELIERYEPCVLWNDYGYPTAADTDSLFGLYFERVPDGVVNDRFDTTILRAALESRGQTTDAVHDPIATRKVHADFVTVEYSTEGPTDRKWEVCRGIGTSFGYNRQESERAYVSGRELIHLFVDIVARGGNLLLNVGPSATGEIPWAQAQRLLELGWWLRTNADAIYKTHPWQRPIGITADGTAVRYTASDDAVHAILLGTSPTDAVDIDVSLDDGARVSLLGAHGDLVWTPSPAGVRIQLPDALDERPAFSLRLSPASSVHEFHER